MRQSIDVLNLEDFSTMTHSMRVADLIEGLQEVIVEIASSYRRTIDRGFAASLNLGGLLHDIGKSQIPLDILNKNGKLTESEYTLVKRHTEYGEKIITTGKLNIDITFDREVLRNMVWLHHERWDGRGYPLGLKGVQIPLEARIASIFDTYEAIRSTRAYKSALSHEFAMQEIERCCGSQFDSTLVKSFVKQESELKTLYDMCNN